MEKSLRFTFRANIDIINSYEYYSLISTIVAENFIKELDYIFSKISSNELSFIKINTKFRQITLKKYPFVVIYEVLENEIVILKVFHTSRNPLKKIK